MEVAILLVWLSCVLTFVSTKHQKLTSLKLSKWIVWGVFVTFNGSSWYMLTLDYPLVSAGLMVLSAVMMMWIAMVLAHGHLKLKLVPFTLTGAVISIGLVQMGGA